MYVMLRPLSVPTYPSSSCCCHVQGASARDTVLQAGALKPLVKCISRNGDSQQICRIGSWAINNICDGQVKVRQVDFHFCISSLMLHPFPPLSHGLSSRRRD